MPTTERTILIVDDDADLREALGDYLSYEGYAVAAASDGAKGLAYLRAHPAPSLILLDYWMPEMNGAAFIDALKREPAWAQIPIAVVTADANAAPMVQQRGIEALLPKPIQVDELLRLAKQFTQP